MVDGAVEESFKVTNPISAESYPISAEVATFSGISGAVLEVGGARTEWERIFRGPGKLC